MAYVRRHWLASVLYGLIILFGLAIFLTPTFFSENAPEAAQAQPAEPQPIDPYLYTRVQKLRQELALTNRDLAAMGFTQESATVLLESIKTWSVSNKIAFDQNMSDEIRFKAALRETTHLINAGSPDIDLAHALPLLQNDLAALYEQGKARHDALIAQLESGMNASQRKTWQSARKNAGLPIELRYTSDLTDQQLQAIRDKLHSTIQTSLSNVINDTLTIDQRQAISAVRVNMAERIEMISDAEDIVLPTPDILRAGGNFKD